MMSRRDEGIGSKESFEVEPSHYSQETLKSPEILICEGANGPGSLSSESGNTKTTVREMLKHTLDVALSKTEDRKGIVGDDAEKIVSEGSETLSTTSLSFSVEDVIDNLKFSEQRDNFIADGVEPLYSLGDLVKSDEHFMIQPKSEGKSRGQGEPFQFVMRTNLNNSIPIHEERPLSQITIVKDQPEIQLKFVRNVLVPDELDPLLYPLDDDAIMTDDFGVEIEGKSKVWQWLRNIPSRPSTVTTQGTPESCSSKESSKKDEILPSISEESFRQNIIRGAKMKYNCSPRRILTPSQRYRLLKSAQAKIPEITGQMMMDPKSFSRDPFVTGVAVLKNFHPKKITKSWFCWLTPLKFLLWLGSLLTFNFFRKTKVKPFNSSNEMYDFAQKESLPCDTIVLKPYAIPTMIDGSTVVLDTFLKGDLQDQVKQACGIISNKLNDMPIQNGSLSPLQKGNNVDPPPINGCTDGESLHFSNVLKANETPSTQEIQRLTNLLKQKQPTLKIPMRSIFGIISVVDKPTLNPEPETDIVQRDAPPPTSTLRRILQRLPFMFWMRPRNRLSVPTTASYRRTD